MWELVFLYWPTVKTQKTIQVNIIFIIQNYAIVLHTTHNYMAKTFAETAFPITRYTWKPFTHYLCTR